MNPNQPVILYAEDEETDAILFQRAFRRASVSQRIVRVPTGKAAMDYLIEEASTIVVGRSPLPCLVLLDVNMPAVSGLDVLRWIRGIRAFDSINVVMLSSSSHPADIDRAYALGANGYLVKPSSPNDISTLAQSIKQTWLTSSAPEVHGLSSRPPTASRPK